MLLGKKKSVAGRRCEKWQRIRPETRVRASFQRSHNHAQEFGLDPVDRNKPQQSWLLLRFCSKCEKSVYTHYSYWGGFIHLIFVKEKIKCHVLPNYKAKHWKTDGISNVSHKSEERLITFSLETFGPVTLIQDAHVNMPYQSWELRPLDVNKVLLTVTTVFMEIQIQIKVKSCYSKSYQREKLL